MTRFPEIFGRPSVRLWLLILAALAGVGAYYAMLTGYTPYDDEGTLMLTVKEYLAGKRLYNDVLSIYGPLYYFYNFLVRTLTSTPVTHDVTRMTSVFPWLVCCLLSAGITLRLTRSLVVAAVNFTLVSMTLAFFHAEPGHTHELTLLVLALFVACPLYEVFASRRWLLMVVMGGLSGALLLIKVNVGIFALASLTLAILAHCRYDSRAWRYLTYAAGAANVLFPAALMRRHLDAPWAQAYCFIATASMAAMVLCLLRGRRPGITKFRDVLLVAAGCFLTVAAAMGVLAARNISLAGVFDSIVVLPSRVIVQNRDWFLPPQFSLLWPAWAAVGLGLAVYAVLTRPSPDGSQERRLLPLKGVLAAASFVAIWFHIDLFPLVAPFAWLVLFNPDASLRGPQEFPRTVLCSVTVVQTLYGYPVYGSQGKFIQVLLILVVTVCAGDFLFALIESLHRPAWLVRHGWTLATLSLAAIALINLRIDYNRYLTYTSMPSLDLPGAHRLHVDATQKEQLVKLTSQIVDSCDVFEGLPGLPSLNFWTGREPVTGFNLQCWTLYLTTAQQMRIIRSLSTHPRACIVYNPVLAAAWNPGGSEDIESLPLVRYIRQEFKPVMASGDYHLLIRNERPWIGSGN